MNKHIQAGQRLPGSASIMIKHKNRNTIKLPKGLSDSVRLLGFALDSQLN
jgi:hypothetical protein